jgi:hypothetical protein
MDFLECSSIIRFRSKGFWLADPCSYGYIDADAPMTDTFCFLEKSQQQSEYYPSCPMMMILAYGVICLLKQAGFA